MLGLLILWLLAVGVESRVNFSQVADNLPWRGRVMPGVSFWSSQSDQSDSIYLYGGYQYVAWDLVVTINDVWLSTDKGLNWTLITETVFNETQNPYTFCTDPYNFISYAMPYNDDYDLHTGVQKLWRTTDQIDWTTVLPQTLDPGISPFLDRWGFSCVVGRGGIVYYLMGLNVSTYVDDTPQYYTDLWSSTTAGSEWKPLKTNMTMPPRFAALVKIHPQNTFSETDVIYVLGGQYLQYHEEYQCQDLWVSLDGGASWQLVLEKLPWYTDYTYEMNFEITSNGILVVLVASTEGLYHSEVWTSLDGGLQWGLCSDQPEYGPRMGSGMGFDSAGYLYVIGGLQVPRNNSYPPDLWISNFSFLDVKRVSKECNVTQPIGPPGLGQRLTKGPGVRQTLSD